MSPKIDVVKSEIPLLLSKESMKVAESKIDFVNDRIKIYGKDIYLHFTTSGHFTIPLNKTNINLKTSSLEDSNFVEVLLTIDNIEEKSKVSTEALKYWVGVQWGHSYLMGEGASLALDGHPSSDAVTIKMPYGVDVLHQPASHPIFSYWVG